MNLVDIPQQIAAINTAYGTPIRLIAGHIGEPTPGIPDAWQPILTAADREAHIAAAIELWPREMRELIPEFWALFEEFLYDVVVVHRGDHPALLYVVREHDEEPALARGWLGFTPATEEPNPLGWDLQPELMQQFLAHSHGGFTMEDGESFGILPPDQWRNWAAAGGWPDGVPGWEPVHLDSRTLITIGTSPSPKWLCVSPELPPGQATFVFDGQTNPQPYWNRIDEFLLGGFMQEPWR